MDLPLNTEKTLASVITRLLGLVIGLVIIIIGLTVSFVVYSGGTGNKSVEKDNATQPEFSAMKTSAPEYWHAPDESELEGNPDKSLILYGKDLIVHTSDYFGPEGKINRNSSNGLNCQNCHLEAGTKVYGNNYSAVASTYPKYRARSGRQENIYKRVNDCFERSLNGEPLDTTSKEMTAIVAYIKWLGKEVAKGEKPKGSGLKELKYPDRAADPVNGKLVYQLKCLNCHQADGAGVKSADSKTFTYPPLWGNKSYNSGAGLYRISNFAKYIKYNMPLGASHDNPQLTDEEAWDIAAYVNSQIRPKADISGDWPKISEKPFDHPFGPFADKFTESQHKFGPFLPIIETQKSKK